MDPVLRELTSVLEECGIEDFTLNATEKKLVIEYKEDFDRFFPKLGDVQPMVHDQNQYGAPYSFGRSAFFDYKGWHISGMIVNSKPNFKSK